MLRGELGQGTAREGEPEREAGVTVGRAAQQLVRKSPDNYN